MPELFESIREVIISEFNSFGGRVTAEVKNRLSVAPQIVRGPRGGKKIVPSSRGEYPRMRSGSLRDATFFEVTDSGGNVSLIVGNAAHHAKFLDPGMGRLILTDVAEEFSDQLLDSLVNGLNNLNEV